MHYRKDIFIRSAERRVYCWTSDEDGEDDDEHGDECCAKRNQVCYVSVLGGDFQTKSLPPAPPDVPMLDARESLAISRYRLRGYDTNTVARKTTNFLLTSSQRTGWVLNEGKTDAMTCGMVSPVDTWAAMSVYARTGGRRVDLYYDSACAHSVEGRYELIYQPVRFDPTHPPRAKAN